MNAIRFLIAAAFFAYSLPAASQEAPKPEAAKPEAKKPEAPKDKTFAEVIKDSTEIKGLFTFYRTEEKVYLERKQGKNIQAVAKNPRFTAGKGSPMSRALPLRMGQALDLGSLLLADVPMMAYELESAFRIPYRFESKSGFFGNMQRTAF